MRHHVTDDIVVGPNEIDRRFCERRSNNGPCRRGER